MASKVFLTGFPGFIAKRLVRRLLSVDPETSFVFLVEKRFEETASRTIKDLATLHPSLPARARVVTGDISKPFLGLDADTYKLVAAGTTHVWHLAAIYDLAVPLSLAYRVNVIGTAHVLDFCAACPNLKRLDYVSTCYVAGLRRGIVLERELDEGQGFKNHYEATKCWAEMEVRRRMDRIPTCIHRPAIVVGDSKTGEIDKYDGPYYVISNLVGIPRWVPLPNIGVANATINLVPVDFVVEAMARLWTMEESVGQTVHLADPYPRSSREIFAAIAEGLGFATPRLDIPPLLTDLALRIEPLRQLLHIPREIGAYISHDVQFDTTTQRKLLEHTGLSCPDLFSYLPVLLDYVRRNTRRPA